MSTEQTPGLSFLSFSPLGTKYGNPHDIDLGNDVFVPSTPPTLGSNDQSPVNLDDLKELTIPGTTQAGLALVHALQERVDRDTHELERYMGIERPRHTIQEESKRTTTVMVDVDGCLQPECDPEGNTADLQTTHGNCSEVRKYTNVTVLQGTKESNDAALRLFTKWAAEYVLKLDGLSCFKTYASLFTRSHINSVDQQKLFFKVFAVCG